MERSAWPLCTFLAAAALLPLDARAQLEDEELFGDDESASAVAGSELPVYLFVNNFEISTPCHWDFIQGWTGLCSVACGDFITTPGEVCDDGNQVTETECPYGTVFCTLCNATCDTSLDLAGAFCGDGDVQVDENEECDDGNTITESECPYGLGFCGICSSGCVQFAAQGDICGDTDVNSPYEDCDDGNTSPCGTCSADCQNPQGASATGMLVVTPGASLVDAETFTIDDGLGGITVFEFDRAGNGVTPPNVQILVTGTPPESNVRNVCLNAINNASGLSISAVAIGSQIITLIHDVQTSAGNVSITENVGNASFAAIGMDGGEAGDCALGVGCDSGADCLSGFCDFGACQIP